MKRLKYPSVSIAIPTLNEEKNIAHCLDSIFSQKYKGRLEVFVIDGGSRDNTLGIAEKYPVKILHNAKLFAEYGKMMALKKAHGKYFFYMDGDLSLNGEKWFEKMIYPLEIDLKIVGSFTRFVSYPSDPPLCRFITLDAIQRDPFFCWLTPSVESVIKEKKNNYFVCEYKIGNIPPAGLCIYRRRQILKTEIGKREKFMELDNLVILVKEGLNKFSYVPNAGVHHPFIPNIPELLRKRTRNIKTMFLGQPGIRYWTWVSLSNFKSVVKLVMWVIYSETVIFAFITGIYKSLKYKTIVGMYEPIVDWLTTNAIILAFVTGTHGGKFLSNAKK
jgi:glycosyltransferase involved in cell wall biosynthesis